MPLDGVSRVLILALVLVALASATTQAQRTTDFVPISDAVLQNPAPGDWLMWRRTFDSCMDVLHGMYSPLPLSLS